MGVCLSTRFKKPSLEQIEAANKKWFNDNNDDKCKVSENFDVTTIPRREKKIRFSEPLVTFIIAADIYDRTTSFSIFSNTNFGRDGSRDARTRRKSLHNSKF